MALKKIIWFPNYHGDGSQSHLVTIHMFRKLLGLLCAFVFTQGTDILVNP